MAWVLARALWAAAGRRGPAGGQRRSASGVWAWGMNTSGQCGTGGLSVVEEPTEVEALRGRRVGSVALGAKHSCVVLEDDGGVLTWGNGACGKLGHGTNDDVKKPSRVEALAGKRIVAAALGDSHSLFADAQGKVWGCGENKEGQLGLGTPLEMLAKQQREAWVMNAALQGEETLPHQKHLTQPGHVAYPSRIGSDLHPIINELFDDLTDPSHSFGEVDADAPSVDDEVVVQVAASKYFSGLLTAGGDVFTMGGGFNGELGGSSSWTTAAQRVTGDVAELLAAGGGAAAIALGSSFTAALTREGGRVVVWGKMGSANLHAPQTSKMPPGDVAAPDLRNESRVVTLQNVPPTITQIAAGASHLLLTDGEKVWHVGQWLPGAAEMALDLDPPNFKQPQEVLALDGGVAAVVASGGTSAVLGRDGSVWIWGAVPEGGVRATPERSAGLEGVSRLFLGGGGGGGVYCVAVKED